MSALRKTRGDVDMTSGSILKHLLMFAYPLLLGNLFQQLYNLVDTWTVGNFVSNEAFSAVGAVTPIVNMLIGTFMGLSNGAGIVIAQYYGARDYDKVSKSVHTAIVSTFILSIVFTAFGVLMAPVFLNMMKIPEEVFADAKDYLTIYFSGISGLLFYNIGASVMQAVGDSRRPFYYLVVCAVINTILDLLFVIKFGLGVKGVAYATIIAQFVSAILIISALFRSEACIKVSFSKLKIHGNVLKQIVRIGIPNAIQMAVTSFSNIFVQSYINFFGANVISGWTAYMKIDAFLMLPMQSIALSASTFVGQNIGKGQAERAKKGMWTALVAAVGFTVIVGTVVMVTCPSLVAFFNSKQEVVEYGTHFLRWMTPFYVFCCCNQIFASSLRGAGHTTPPMIVMLATFVGLRQLYLFVVTKFIANTVLAVTISYPTAWLTCAVVLFIYYTRVDFGKNAITKKA